MEPRPATTTPGNRGHRRLLGLAALGLIGAVTALGMLPAVAATKTVVVKAKSTSLGVVLTNAQGFTLYRFSHDTPTMVSCTGSCAAVWPPLTVPAGASLSGPHGLSTVKDPDGARQVTYRGEPLYRYSGDSAPGQLHGQGVEGSWFVVKTAKTAPATTGTKSSSRGYGY